MQFLRLPPLFAHLRAFPRCVSYSGSLSANATELRPPKAGNNTYNNDDWRGHYKYASSDGLGDAGPTLWIAAMFVGLFGFSTCTVECTYLHRGVTHLLTSSRWCSVAPWTGALVAPLVLAPNDCHGRTGRDSRLGSSYLERKEPHQRHAVPDADFDHYYLVRLSFRFPHTIPDWSLFLDPLF